MKFNLLIILSLRQDWFNLVGKKNYEKNEFSSLKFSNAFFAIEPKVCPNKKQIINDGSKVYNFG